MVVVGVVVGVIVIKVGIAMVSGEETLVRPSSVRRREGQTGNGVGIVYLWSYIRYQVDGRGFRLETIIWYSKGLDRTLLGWKSDLLEVPVMLKRNRLQGLQKSMNGSETPNRHSLP